MKKKINFIFALRNKIIISGLLMLICIAFFSSCKKDVNLSLLISQQPSGGYQVNTVSASFEGYILVKRPKKSIEVTAEWWWENGNHANAKTVKTEHFSFNSNDRTTKSSSYGVQTGYVLINYYWLKLKWTDDSGPHTLESSKAYCWQ